MNREEPLVRTLQDDGIIELDSEVGREFGFTSDKFDGWLGKQGNYIYVSFIISKQPNQGNFHNLIEAIHKHGFMIKVPTPFFRMKIWCKNHHFKRTIEEGEPMGRVEVWVETDAGKDRRHNQK